MNPSNPDSPNTLPEDAQSTSTNPDENESNCDPLAIPEVPKSTHSLPVADPPSPDDEFDYMPIIHPHTPYSGESLVAQIPWNKHTRLRLLLHHPSVYRFMYHLPSRPRTTTAQAAPPVLAANNPALNPPAAPAGYVEHDITDRAKHLDTQEIPGVYVWVCHSHIEPVTMYGHRAFKLHIASHFEHTPRYHCRCGVTFTASPAAFRHKREQAICMICQRRSVGRNGEDGQCRHCL